MTRPSFEQLSAAPELATLAVLETAASMAILALGAEYPELASDSVDRREPDLRAAIELIKLARAVDLAIARYRCAIAVRREREREEGELLPF